MKFGLVQHNILKIQTIFLKYEKIDRVVIFGSRAIGNYRNGSYIDLTLVGNNITNEILSKIMVEIDDLNLPYLFDISIFDKLESKEFIDHIHRVGQIFYKK